MLGLLFLLVVALYVFSYHYERNGNPINGGDFLSRIFWSIGFTLGYFLLGGWKLDLLLAVWMFLGGFLEILIPHGFAQNMGKRTQTWDEMPSIPLFTVFGKALTLPKWWPALWMAPFKNKLSFTWQDLLGMGTVGFMRGAIVFAPCVALGLGLLPVIAAILITAFWQPFAYWVGNRTPFNIWTNTANSSTWGEFYIGIGWALAVLVVV